MDWVGPQGLLILPLFSRKHHWMICYGPDSLNCIYFVQEKLSIIKEKVKCFGWWCLFVCFINTLLKSVFWKEFWGFGRCFIECEKCCCLSSISPWGWQIEGAVIADTPPVLQTFKCLLQAYNLMNHLPGKFSIPLEYSILDTAPNLEQLCLKSVWEQFWIQVSDLGEFLTSCNRLLCSE